MYRALRQGALHEQQGSEYLFITVTKGMAIWLRFCIYAFAHA